MSKPPAMIDYIVYKMAHFVRLYLSDFLISRVAIAIASGIVIREPNFVWRIISFARSLMARLRSYADNAAQPFFVQCLDIMPHFVKLKSDPARF